MEEAVARLVADLARPVLVYRLARPLVDRQDHMGTGARKRVASSVAEIDQIVRGYQQVDLVAAAQRVSDLLHERSGTWGDMCAQDVTVEEIEAALDPPA